MYIGKLNNITNIQYKYLRRADGTVPSAKFDGNPFCKDTLHIDWMQIMEDSVVMTVTLNNTYFIGDIVLNFAEKGTPYDIIVRSADDSRVLARHTAETGANITPGPLTLTVDETLSEFAVEFYMNFTSLILESAEIYGSETGELPLFPIPKSHIHKDGTLSVTALTSYFADCEDAHAAAEKFAEKFTEITSLECAEAKSAALSFHLDSSVTANGFSLNVTDKNAEIKASDLRGFVYGAETLIKLIQDNAVPCCTIDDAPRMNYRGVHLFMPGASEMEFARRLIKYVISPMGYNSVIIEIAGAMRFDSHPEINEAVQHALKMSAEGKWPTFPHGTVGNGEIVEKSVLSEFADYVRSFGIDVVPEVQSLAHIQFITAAHPDIAERESVMQTIEVDEMDADVPPIKFYPHSYCPSNEKSYEIVFDLLDEIIETFKPKQFVHMGHDEVYEIGICPICKHKDPAELFASDVNRYHAYLKEKGLRMMIWADMVQPAQPYKTVKAIDMIPKDIVLLDFVWYFHPTKDIEDNLIGKGFDIVYGNMYSSHFPRYESRIVKPDIIGAQISTWVGTNEKVIAQEGKFYDLLYTAEMLWSEEYDSHLRYAYDKKIRAMIPEIRRNLRAEAPLAGNEKVLFENNICPTSAKAVSVNLTPDSCAEAIVFTHTALKHHTRIPWTEHTAIANYEIQYTDGAVEIIPITYGGNICHYARRQNEPFKSQYYRHNGYCGTYLTDSEESKTADGTPVSLYRLTWRNPHADKVIKSIRLTDNPAFSGEVLVTRIAVVKK